MYNSVHSSVVDRSVHVNSLYLEVMLNHPTPRKMHLLNIAQSLFNRQGYHRTGIDAIMRASGVSKTTLYKYFRTKEDLVLELLTLRSEAILDAMKAGLRTVDVRTENATALDHVDAILDVVEHWLESEEFCGCNFIRAVSEYESENGAITGLARQHKATVKALIADQISDIPSVQSDVMSEQIMLIIDGAIVSAHVRERADAMKTARTLVHAVLLN